MGVDVMYSKLQSATVANGTAFGAGALTRPNVSPVAPPCALRDDPDNWSFRFRVHRDFYP